MSKVASVRYETAKRPVTELFNEGPDVAPPPTNRGVRFTSEVESVESADGLDVNLATGEVYGVEATVQHDEVHSARLDWFSFTLPQAEGESVLGMFAHEIRRNAQGDVLGMLGYSVSAQLPKGGLCAWRGNNDTMWFSFPSAALGWMVEHVDFDYVARLVNEKGNCTRLDIAFDDRSGAFTVQDFADAYREDDSIVTRYRSWREIQSGKVVVDDDDDDDDDDNKESARMGHTFYLGSSQSDSCIRVYDKLAEMESKGEELEDDRPWVRVEFQARGNVASKILSHFVRGGLDRVAEVVSGYCQWRVPSEEDTNKSRWPVVEFWAALIGSVRRKLQLPGKVDSLSRSVDWLGRQVSTTLVALRDVMGPVKFNRLLHEIMAGADDRRVRLKILQWGVSV